MDGSLPGSSVHGILQARKLEWVAIAILQGIFPTQESNTGLPHYRQILYHLNHQGRPRILEWVAYPFSRASSWSRNWTGVSCIARRLFTSWATKEAHSITMPQMKWSFFSSSNIPRSFLPLQLLLYFLFASLISYHERRHQVCFLIHQSSNTQWIMSVT